MNAKVVVTGAMFALFLAALEQTIVATALPAMLADLGHVELGSWVITAYLLSAVCATPVLGKLSDLAGRAIVMRGSLALFLVGCALCALAPTMSLLIAARAVQGAGGGGLIVTAQALVGDAVPPRERGRYASYFSIVWMSAAVLGPVLGGALTEHVGWRWVFWINFPIAALSLVLAERGLRQVPVVRRKAQVDLLGMLLLSVMSIALLVLASRARVLSWGLAPTALLVIAAGAAVAFVRREARAPEPIVPPHFLTDPVILPVLASGFLIYGSYIALSVVMPLYFQLGLGLPASLSGLLIVPMILTSSITAYLGGRYTNTHGRYRRPPLVTLPIAIGACAALALTASSGNAAVVATLAAILALGIGTIFPCTVVAGQAAAGPQHLGAVSGAIALARALGAALITGLLIALLLNIIIAALPELAGVSSLEELVRRPLDPHARSVVLRAFGTVAWIVAVVLAAGLFVFMRVEDRELARAA